MVVFFQLKSLYRGGMVRNYTKRYEAIAKEFGISVSKLRNYISILRKEGWVKKDHNGSLILSSRTYLTELYGVSKFCYKIKTEQLMKLEDIFKTLALQENLDKQKYVVTRKLVNRTIETEGKANSCQMLKKQLKLVNSRVKKNFDTIILKEKERFERDIVNSIKTKQINPFLGFSRQGIAKIFNKKSKSSGQRLVSKLKKKELICIDEYRNTLLCENVTYEYYLHVRNNLLENNIYCLYIKNTGNIYIRHNNYIELDHEYMFL